MKQMLTCLALSTVLLFPLLAGAHGNATHILGTVTEASQNQVTVKTPKGKTVTLHFNDETIFQKNGITTQKARPQVGNRLIAEANTIDGKLVAIEVKFASPKTK